MNQAGPADISFVEADDALRKRLGIEWSRNAAKYMHIDDGFSIIAITGDKIVGLISVQWRELPTPLPPTREGYIDIIEVVDQHRRKGIARHMIRLCENRARAEGMAQLRSWSTNDKREAIPMWKALGFSLCPTTHMMWGPEITGYFVAKRLD